MFTHRYYVIIAYSISNKMYMMDYRDCQLFMYPIMKSINYKIPYSNDKFV